MNLEDAIQEEKEQTNSSWDDDLMDHEERLQPVFTSAQVVNLSDCLPYLPCQHFCREVRPI